MPRRGEPVKKLPHGSPLGSGLVVSRRFGGYVAVYLCAACGGEQAARREGFPGGLLEETAERFGWRRINGSWECPNCTGNTTNLKKFMDGQLRDPGCT